MYSPGEVINYIEMSVVEGANLQRGMNFRHKPEYSVILMSLRKGAPYRDRVEDDGQTLIYEGHDAPKQQNRVDVKRLDQPMMTPGGRLTQNGYFYEAALSYKNGEQPPEIVRVYEKIKDGIWVYNGVFELHDAWQESDSVRLVFRFKFRLSTGEVKS